MTNLKRILSEVEQLEALAYSMIDKATKVRAMLAGDGKTPASTRKDLLEREVATALAKRTRTMFRKKI